MRRTMISLRGFQPPRSSTHHNSSGGTASPSTAQDHSSGGDASSPGHVRQPAGEHTATARARRSPVVNSPPRLGGHFSANRHLMGQAKAARQSGGGAGSPDSEARGGASGSLPIHCAEDPHLQQASRLLTAVDFTTTTTTSSTTDGDVVAAHGVAPAPVRGDPAMGAAQTHQELTGEEAVVAEAEAENGLDTHWAHAHVSRGKKPRPASAEEEATTAKSRRCSSQGRADSWATHEVGLPSLGTDPCGEGVGHGSPPWSPSPPPSSWHGLTLPTATAPTTAGEGTSGTGTPTPQTPAGAFGSSLFLMALQPHQPHGLLSQRWDRERVGDGVGGVAYCLPSSQASDTHPRTPVKVAEEERECDSTECAPLSPLLADHEVGDTHTRRHETAEEDRAAPAEMDHALAREVEEDLRLSEDLPFTPRRTSGASRPSSQTLPPLPWEAGRSDGLTAPPGTPTQGRVVGTAAGPALASAEARPTEGLDESVGEWGMAVATSTCAGDGDGVLASPHRWDSPALIDAGPSPALGRKRTVFVLSTTATGQGPVGGEGSALAPRVAEPPSHAAMAGVGEAHPTDPQRILPLSQEQSHDARAEPPPTPLPANSSPSVEGGRRRTCFTLPPAPPRLLAAAETVELDARAAAVETQGGGPGECREVGSLAPRSPGPVPLSPPSWYDLPPLVQALFAAHRGVTTLYPWQHDLLLRPDVRQGGNFVYSMPTSGGKTLVAELSLLRCVLNRKQSAFFVVPYVSLAEEKTTALQPFSEALGVAVDGHYGSTGRYPVPPAPAIFVCTMEKANSLLNYLLEEGRGDELGTVVVDELHMLGEPRRGATLELFLSKLMMMADDQRRRAMAATTLMGSDGEGNGPDDHHLPPLPPQEQQQRQAEGKGRVAPVQVIGMSATIPNLRTIADWLRAAVYEGTDRPVPLREYSVVDGLVLRNGEVNERNLSGRTEVDQLFELAFEVPDASVLVFCASRQQCEDTAKGLVLYARRMTAAQSTSLTWTTAAVGAQPSTTPPGVRALADELQSLAPSPETALLTELVSYGVAFHHGGLLAEEREAIEGAYRSRLLRILCCTSTLAAGVNLPARRVILKTPYVGREFLTKARYLQMCGRAGRAGYDAYGESFLLLSRRDRDRGHRLLRQPIEPCLSYMLEDPSHLSRSLLECVTVRLVRSRAAAVHGWGAHLLASYAMGPVDGSFAGALRARLGDVAAAAAMSSEGTGGEAEGGGTGTEVESSPAVMMANTLPAAAAAESDSVPVYDPAYSNSNSNGFTEPTASGRAGGKPSPGLTSQPLRPAEYIAAVRARWPAGAIVSALIEDALAVLAGADLVRLTREAEAAAVPRPLTVAEGTRAYTGTIADASPVAASPPEKEGEQQQQQVRSPVSDVQVGPTPFGTSAVRSCFSVEEALLVRGELENLRMTGLILGDDLHLCYFLTPLREVGDCDWRTYTYLFAHLTDSQQRIANMLGVSEQFITMRAMGLGGGRSDHDVPTTVEGKRDFFTARRFFVALMLCDVLSEVPMDEVEARYHVKRGQLQSLMRSASMFSSSITSFCHAMEWFSLEAVLASFVKRLGFGVKPDLVPLMEVRNVQPGRARALWNAGFKTPALIAACVDPDEMVRKVKACNPPDSKSAMFFTRRSALALIRQANLLLESQIREKKDELQQLTRRSV